MRYCHRQMCPPRQGHIAGCAALPNLDCQPTCDTDIASKWTMRTRYDDCRHSLAMSR